MQFMQKIPQGGSGKIFDHIQEHAPVHIKRVVVVAHSKVEGMHSTILGCELILSNFILQEIDCT